jgi:hypothetical protein
MPPANNNVRNMTRQIQVGIGVCSPSPAQTPANLESTWDFLMFFNIGPIPSGPHVFAVEASITRKIIMRTTRILNKMISVLVIIFAA